MNTTTATTQVNGTLFASMIRGGASNLNRNRVIVNELNVFPIPDGDTGDNMLMTIRSGSDAVNAEGSSSVGNAAATAAQGMLLGARGNSGVILSRIFAGISRGLENVEAADVKTFSRALLCGVEEAYGAVSVPVEGTILTVYRDAVNYANSRIRSGSTLESYLADLVMELRSALDRTPDQLPVLKEAGVVDSGGAGFVFIAEGMQQAVNGTAGEDLPSAAPAKKGPDLSLFNRKSVLQFGYCTEFLLQLTDAKTDVDAFRVDDLTAWMEAHGGESIVAFAEGTVIKVHVHTMEPGVMLNHCQQYGEFLTMKIENMMLQHEESTVRNNYRPIEVRKHKRYGVVAVASGDGIRDSFFTVGVDEVVSGGQSMNPSAEEFLRAFDRINADTIFVFPNNGNILLTARQAAGLYDKAEIRVIPSRSIGEGYAAISMMELSGEPEDIEATCAEVMANVVTGGVSRAVRDTVKDGVTVVKDDYIGFRGDTILVDAGTPEEAVRSLAGQLGAEDHDVMLLIAGDTVPAETLAALAEEFTDACPMTEVIPIAGGMPVYQYLLVLE